MVGLRGITSHIGQSDKKESWLKAIFAYSKTYGTAAATYARIELEERLAHR